jgi:pimeloyl-ACP methyl ester carboxylesterase
MAARYVGSEDQIIGRAARADGGDTARFRSGAANALNQHHCFAGFGRAPTVPSNARPADSTPSLVALHSSAAGARQWAAYPALCPGHWQWQAPALIGYDGTPLQRGAPPLTLDAEAQRLAPLLPEGRRTHLVGHSYGGAVALQLALRWPERVQSLTLYEPVRFGLLRQAAPALWDTIHDFGSHVGALVMGGSREASARAFVDYWSGPGSWHALAPQRQAGVLRAMPKVRLEFQALFTDPLEPALLRRLRMPVRVVRGWRSPDPVRAVAATLAAHCAAGELLDLPDANHMTPLLEPARFAATLLAHGVAAAAA